MALILAGLLALILAGLLALIRRRSNDECSKIMPSGFTQIAQIVMESDFPFPWEKDFHFGEKYGFEINLLGSKVQLVFGKTIWYIGKADDLTVGQVFDQIYHSSFLSGKEYRLELDEWCAMGSDVFLRCP